MTSIKLKINDLVTDTASREKGAALRLLLLENLKNHQQVELDFSDINLTPSFADEAFGLLSQHLSKTEFLERIKFTQLSPTHKALLLRVIGNRFNKKM